MRIAICVPAHGDVKPGFALSLFDLAAECGASLGRNVRMFLGRGSMLPAVRNFLVEQALEWGADWLLWLDADHKFPDDVLARLLAHDVPIVSCNYPRRLPPLGPTASRDGEPVWTEPGKGLEDVDSLGLGVCLIRRDVFLAVVRPWFRFDIKADGAMVSEDVVFFRAAKAAGFAPHVDHELSLEIGHIGERILTNSNVRRGNADTILPAAGAQ